MISAKRSTPNTEYFIAYKWDQINGIITRHMDN